MPPSGRCNPTLTCLSPTQGSARLPCIAVWICELLCIVQLVLYGEEHKVWFLSVGVIGQGNPLPGTHGDGDGISFNTSA